jgi:hypothetical protein
MVGGASAGGVVVVNATTITLTCPPGPPGVVTISVTNANGTASLPGVFTYVVPVLYVAEGGGVPATLWRVDPATLTAVPIGPVGFSITAMARHPNGTIYAAEATALMFGPRNLLTINPTTGAGTPIGLMQDGGGTLHTIPDMTFVGTRLIGMNGPGSATVEIMPATGLVVPQGPTPTNPGGGIATDPTGLVLWADLFGGNLNAVNPTNGAITTGPPLAGATNTRINAMTYLEGVLYGVDANSGAPGSGADLVTINIGTGAITHLMTLPIDVDAIAGNFP